MFCYFTALLGAREDNKVQESLNAIILSDFHFHQVTEKSGVFRGKGPGLERTKMLQKTKQRCLEAGDLGVTCGSLTSFCDLGQAINSSSSSPSICKMTTQIYIVSSWVVEN